MPTDILQGGKYTSICLVIPTYIGLMKNLEKVKEKNRRCHGLIVTLTNSLEIGHVITQPLYCISTFPNPQFKLKWCSHSLQVKAMILSGVSVFCHSPSGVPSQVANETTNRDESEPPVKKTKMARLFSFMEETDLQTSCDIEEEYQAYLNYQILEITEISKNPLTFWKKNSLRFPQLAIVVRKYFTVPATSNNVERVFSQAGKTLHQDRSHLLPKNLANLVF